MRTFWAKLLLVLVALTVVVKAQEPATDDPTTRMRAAIASLMTHYDSSRGLWDSEGWWNGANSTTELGEAAAVDPGKYEQTLATTFNKASSAHIGKQPTHAGFRNEFYDDEGWWALAWIQAYDVTHRVEFLKMAESIVDDMIGGWDNTCGGGIWWKKDRKYKNAIPNELFLSATAHLANRLDGKKQKEYLDWAQREWAWFDKSGMFNGDGLINDGLTPGCTNNGRTTWSYNQGVVLGGLAELSKATNDPKLIDRANGIAHAAMKKLTDKDGVLHDWTEPNCSGDTVQFKGIFVRNLLILQKASPHDEYVSFVKTNADAVWNDARTPANGFACRWTGPAEDKGAGATTSALAPLIGAVMVK